MASKISAVIVDTHENKLLPRCAIERTLQCHSIGKVYTFSDEPYFDGANFIKIPEIKNIKDYERWVLGDVLNFVNEDFLVIQWDGFVLNPGKWREEFRSFDFIGAPHTINSALQVGNGGFSFRSIRLMEAVTTLRNSIDQSTREFPEDVLITIKWREELERLGISFPPLELASQFAFQEGALHDRSNIFGFHSPWCFPLFFDEKGLLPFAGAIVERISNFAILTNYLFNCRENKLYELLIQSINEIERHPSIVQMIDTQLKDGNAEWTKRFIEVMGPL